MVPAHGPRLARSGRWRAHIGSLPEGVKQGIALSVEPEGMRDHCPDCGRIVGNVPGKDQVGEAVDQRPGMHRRPVGHVQLLAGHFYAAVLRLLRGLGQTAPNPVLSTLRYFRDEYLALIEDSCKFAG